ncbi:MAG: phosphotransferase [Oscillospiraceae bacterium]|jgi:Ser/Thr protein kinase RdoA (MazF antagonist)|nr:phosphotransferase [Oscillospiraceae bacterium]
MLVVKCSDIDRILKDFGSFEKTKYVSELQRDNYEKNDPASKEVRLVVKAGFVPDRPLVIRFKNETDVTAEIMESQCRFADEMRKNGVMVPRQYQTNNAFARWYDVNEYHVLVTVEEFVENEVTAVDAAIAEKTGELLAKMHSISEKNDLHVSSAVLFDPFAANDLFDTASFLSLAPAFSGSDQALFNHIVRKYDAYMEVLSPLKRQPRYAVQGDISCCNLFQTCSGEIGIFDFNRCGDNNLFCDAVMQAVFEARLMDYQDGAGDVIRADILTSFLRGYRSVRNFSEEQQNWYPHLYAVINAFWSSDIRWKEDSLLHSVKNGNMRRAREWLETIWQRLAI